MSALDRGARAGYGLLLAAAITGLAVFALPVGAAGYFGLIDLHRWIAMPLVALTPLALGRHLAATSSGAWGTGVALALGGVLAIPVPYLLVMPEEEHDRGPAGFLLDSVAALVRGDGSAAWPALAGGALLALVAGASTLTLVGVASRVRERDASRRTGLALTMLCAWAWSSGALLLLEGVFTLRSAQMFHSFAGCWAAGVLGVHLGAKRAAAARLPRAAVVVGGLIGLLAFGAVWGGWTRAQGQRMQLASYRTPATDVERQASLDPHSDLARAPAERLTGSDTCGSAGCHEAVYDQWRGSPHRFSATNAFYRAAVDEVVRTRGLSDAVACATCHDPARALAGTVGEAYADGAPATGEGVTCVACHAITGARSHPPGNGQYAVAIETSYPADPAAAVRAVRLDARRHQTAFAGSDAIYGNAPCRVCHRVEHHGQVLQDSDMPGADDPDPPMKCRTCHLPPEGPITYSHRMVGIAADLPLYVGSDDRDAAERHAALALRNAGLRERVPLDGAWEPRPDGRSVGSLRLEAEVEADALVVTAVTSRGPVGAGGHSFPSGPVDLQQVWLEVLVTDADGAVLHHVGDLQDGGIVGEPPRLGAVALDGDGAPIDRHRVLDVAQVVDRRLLRADRRPLRDTLRIGLPADIAWPLEVRARWLHRRTDPAFAAWALGVPRSPVPARELVGAAQTVQAP